MKPKNELSPDVRKALVSRAIDAQRECEDRTTLVPVPTGNGEPDLWRDSERRAYWADRSRVTAHDLTPEAHEYADDPAAAAEKLRDVLTVHNLTALGNPVEPRDHTRRMDDFEDALDYDAAHRRREVLP